jgi:RNA polymerase sigma-70 factor (ECF subfamily)
MPTPEWLVEQFEQHRAHLRAVAYRMLGSASEVDDAVQESWIRLGRTDVSDVQNLRALIQRVCDLKGSAQSGQNFRKKGGQNLRNPQQVCVWTRVSTASMA